MSSRSPPHALGYYERVDVDPDRCCRHGDQRDVVAVRHAELEPGARLRTGAIGRTDFNCGRCHALIGRYNATERGVRTRKTPAHDS